ncbi:MAG: DUF6159 family protein [Acidimicrobiales bacterium]|jgi:hypothetical protein|nr:DUF6159 family protein [Acidimicrobiales bacterium]MED5600063.1 DUF6159 family protein [Actinomycetota bacterium]HAZ36085.1 hypothetical protein [Acidimicrobiaceae bacterium]HIE68129.1 hypothetical protein [Acidimicrobiia bacterium]HIL48799.1 hypothetical protein [Acidimicrobiia bacterium]|tara:strand:+ start:1362 stop:2192 length:831 start_codon:yes stop_codon:yes gene_type:complete
MGRISNTIALAKVSWKVLRKDRELLLLPVLSFLASIVVLALLWLPTLSAIDTSGLADESGDPGAVLIVVGVISAMAMSIISVFFNGALVAGAHERLSGGDPTVRSALGRALSRLSGLLPWAIITGTVGLILQAARERAGWMGRFVVNMVGMAWQTATFLVVPAIVIDDHGAVSGLKASAALLKRTWGENIAARVGFGLLGIVAIIPAVIVLFATGALGGAALVVGILLAVPYLALVVVVLTALNAVFQTALYLYATTGSVPAGFDDSNLQASFSTR